MARLTQQERPVEHEGGDQDRTGGRIESDRERQHHDSGDADADPPARETAPPGRCLPGRRERKHLNWLPDILERLRAQRLRHHVGPRAHHLIDRLGDRDPSGLR